MLVSRKRNGVARVPTRAKLVPTVVAWQRKKPTTLAIEPQREQLPEQKAEVFATLTNTPPAIEFTYAMLPEWAIKQALAAFPTEAIPPPVATCLCCHGRHWWRSVYGPHLICWDCHRPAFLNVVAEHIEP